MIGVLIKREIWAQTVTQREGNVKRRRKMVVHKPRREAWNRRQHLISDLQPPALWENIFPLF